MLKTGRTLIIIMALIWCGFAMNTKAADIVDSGKCGETATWSLDSEGLLTISGSGEMDGSKPWNKYTDDIKEGIVENGITKLGNYAFGNCYNLKNVTLPDGLTTIDYGAFSWCQSLEKISIPDSVTFIGDSAFYSCYNMLGAITIPNEMTKIGRDTFYGCGKLTKVVIPAGITDIEYGAFHGCGITEITIPDSVTNIGAFAFEGCRFTEIDIPDSVTDIGESAFCGCQYLTEIEIPEGIDDIGSYTFAGCTNLTNIILPEGVQTIGDDCFASCGNLNEIILPGSVSSIGECAFYYCTSLSSIKLPESLTSLGRLAFHGCFALTEITIPKNVTSIGESLFCSDSSLSKIIVDENNPVYDSRNQCNAIIETNTNKLVAGCKNTKIPNDIRSIGGGAFNDCDGLTQISIPDGVTSIGDSAFASCDGLTKISLPNSVQSIGNNAFEGCHSITKITLSNSLTSIGNYAFYLCGFRSVTLPKSLNSIGEEAFTDSEITDIYYIGSQNDWEAIDIISGGGISDSVRMHYVGMESIEFIPAAPLTMMEYGEDLEDDHLSEILLRERYESLGGTPFKQGAKLIIKTADTVKTFVYNENAFAFVSGSEKLKPYEDVDYRIKPDTLTMVFSYMGVDSADVPITITENPIKDFRLEFANPVTMQEGKDFVWRDSYGTIYHEDKIINEDATLFITTKDGEKVYTYDGSGGFKNGSNRYYVWIDLVKRDGLYTFIANCYYKKAVIPVEVKGNSVSSISYTSATDIELTIGKDLALEDMDGRLFDMGTIEGAGAYGYFCKEGDRLSVVYNGVGTREYEYSEDDKAFVNTENEDDLILKRDIRWTFWESRGIFTPGTDYLKITYSDKSDKVPFTVLENPVESIAFTPAGGSIDLMENVDVNWFEEDGVRYSADRDSINQDKIFAEGAQLIVTKEGTEYTYVYSAEENAFLCGDEKIEKSEILYNTYCPDGEWTVGGDNNQLSLKYFGKRTLVDVNIISYDQAVADQAKAALVTRMIQNLPETKEYSGNSDEEALVTNLAAEYGVTKAVNAYESLTDRQKALVGENETGSGSNPWTVKAAGFFAPMVVKAADSSDGTLALVRSLYKAKELVDDAARKFAELEAGKKQNVTSQVLSVMDKAQKNAISDVSYNIRAIPEESDELENAMLEQIKEDYAGLSSVGKYVVEKKTKNLRRLVAAEVQLLIKALPAKITLAAEKDVKAARTAYDKLTRAEKELVGDIYSKLVDAEKAIEKEKEAKKMQEAENSKTASSNRIIKVKEIRLTGISKMIARGTKIKLTATVLPVKATNKKLSWSTSNKKLATVTQTGLVKIAKKAKPGKIVKITVRAKDGSGKKQVFKIKIMKGAVKKITVTGYKKTLKVGKSMQLKAQVKTTKGKPVNKKLKWTSDKPKFVKVSKNGKVTALKGSKGKTVKIKVESTDGTGKKVVKSIKVK